MIFPVINPNRTASRASVDGATLHTQVCAIIRGLCAFGSFYSNSGLSLLPEIGMGRALWACCARPAFSKIGGASCAA